MPVDDHLLSKPGSSIKRRLNSTKVDDFIPSKPVPSTFDIPAITHKLQQLTSAPPASQSAPAETVLSTKPRKTQNVSGITRLGADLRKLTSSINELMHIFRKAHEDIKAEPHEELMPRIDKLVEQNEEMARALLLLLELHREHIPQIAKHARISSELKLRWPPTKIFSEQMK